MARFNPYATVLHLHKTAPKPDQKTDAQGRQWVRNQETQRFRLSRPESSDVVVPETKTQLTNMSNVIRSGQSTVADMLSHIDPTEFEIKAEEIAADYDSEEAFDRIVKQFSLPSGLVDKALEEGEPKDPYYLIGFVQAEMGLPVDENVEPLESVDPPQDEWFAENADWLEELRGNFLDDEPLGKSPAYRLGAALYKAVAVGDRPCLVNIALLKGGRSVGETRISPTGTPQVLNESHRWDPEDAHPGEFDSLEAAQQHKELVEFALQPHIRKLRGWMNRSDRAREWLSDQIFEDTSQGDEELLSKSILYRVGTALYKSATINGRLCLVKVSHHDRPISGQQEDVQAPNSLGDRPSSKAHIYRVYHATTAKPFQRFDPNRRGTATDEGKLGAGFYFSTDPNVAQQGQRTATVDVSLSNPLRIALPHWEADKTALVNDAIGTNALEGQELADTLVNLGYDGVILDFSGLDYPYQEIAVFSDSQATIQGFSGVETRARDKRDIPSSEIEPEPNGLGGDQDDERAIAGVLEPR